MAKSDTDKLVEQLGGMTVLDLVELKNKLEEEWGVSAAAPVAVAAPGGASAGGRKPVPAIANGSTRTLSAKTPARSVT